MPTTKKYLDEEGLSILAKTIKRYINKKTGKDTNDNFRFYEDGSFRIGKSIVQDGAAFAIGINEFANNTASIAIGTDGEASGGFDLAVGIGSCTSGDGDIAIGHWACTYEGNSLTAGNIAIGKEAEVYNINGVEGAIAIGSYSLATEDYEFSIGDEDLTRRITHVQDGINDTDACTVGQLNAAINTLEAESGNGGINYTAGNGIDITSDVISLGIASANNIGGIKIGDGLSIDENGVVSVTATVYSPIVLENDTLIIPDGQIEATIQQTNLNLNDTIINLS